MYLLLFYFFQLSDKDIKCSVFFFFAICTPIGPTPQLAFYMYSVGTAVSLVESVRLRFRILLG